MSAEQVADHVSLGARQLSRAFKEAFGMTPSQYIQTAQVERARELLSSTDQPLEKIAMRCGFSGRQQMVRAFEKVMQTTPTAFRDQLRNR